MFFNSTLFIVVFFPVTFAVYWLVPPRLRNLSLVVASLVFYAYAGIAQCVLLFIMLTLTYLSARYLISTDRWRAWGLALSLVNLLILAALKYAALVPSSNASSLTITESLFGIALPLGISFYTFNLLSYSFDVYRRRIPPTNSILEFATYITFFPALLSGPLVRFANFQSQEKPSFQLENVEQGLFCFCIGLSKKVILADSFARIADPLFLHYEHIGFLGAWIAAVAYTYQIYFDFSGYTDMAIGAAYLLGFRLPKNFNAPYAALTITDFWQRWHITLSTWFRDYVFTPFSREALKRDGKKHSSLIRTASHVLTMALIGLWHGASWPFLAWGIYHGILLSAYAQVRPVFASQMTKWLGRLTTFMLVIVGWVLFRSPSIGVAVSIYRSMLGFDGLGKTTLVQIIPDWGLGLLSMFFGIAFISTNLPFDTWSRQFRPGWVYIAVFSFLFVMCVILLDQPSIFLYLRF